VVGIRSEAVDLREERGKRGRVHEGEIGLHAVQRALLGEGPRTDVDDPLRAVERRRGSGGSGKKLSAG